MAAITARKSAAVSDASAVFVSILIPQLWPASPATSDLLATAAIPRTDGNGRQARRRLVRICRRIGKHGGTEVPPTSHLCPADVDPVADAQGHLPRTERGGGRGPPRRPGGAERGRQGRHGAQPGEVAEWVCQAGPFVMPNRGLWHAELVSPASLLVLRTRRGCRVEKIGEDGVRGFSPRPKPGTPQA